MNELALFAGAGGGILGGVLLGWRTVCAVEIDAYCAGVLVQRQNDGILPPFPIWDDVRTFDGKPWRGIVDVVSGGFPCQDISCAGRGGGIDGERSGLWREMARIIGEVRPRYVLVENSPILTSRGLGRVLGDLAALGYDAEWGVLGAVDVGANHRRKRIWIVGNSRDYGRLASQITDSTTKGINYSASWENEACKFKGSGKQFASVAHAEGNAVRPGLCASGQAGQRRRRSGDGGSEEHNLADASIKGLEGQNTEERQPSTGRALQQYQCDWWAVEPDVGRVANGVAFRVDRLKAIGNGQVPAVVRSIWELLTNR